MIKPLSAWRFGLSFACVLSLAALLAAGQEAKKEDRLYTTTYEIAELLARSPARSGIERGEEIIHAIMSAINPTGWRDGGSTIQLENGSSLVVHTSAKHHQEVVDILDAFRRLIDGAVDMHGCLCEMDRRLYEKAILPKVGNAQGAGVPLVAKLDPAAYRQLRDQLQPITSNRVRIGNGKEVEFLSLQNAIRYGTRTRPLNAKEAGKAGALDVQEAMAASLAAASQFPRDPFAILGPKGEPGVSLVGVRFRSSVLVSADRRFVRLYLTEEVADLLGMDEFVLDQNAKEQTIQELPRIGRSSIAATVAVEDGQVVVLPVHYLPKEAKAKNRVWVLVAQPTIYIEAEQKELQKLPGLP